jgi:hypothetical protein
MLTRHGSGSFLIYWASSWCAGPRKRRLNSFAQRFMRGPSGMMPVLRVSTGTGQAV